MTDFQMHVLACYAITLVVCVIVYSIKDSNFMRMIEFPGSVFIFMDIILMESVVVAICVSMIIGVGKEVIDIFRSDPQFVDIAADAIGTFFGALTCLAIGKSRINHRRRKFKKWGIENDPNK